LNESSGLGGHTNKAGDHLLKLFHAVGLGVFLICGGCASLKGIHLYSSTDDKIATEALSSFKDAKVDQTVVDERALQDRLLARELAGSDRLADASRDAVLLAALGGPDKHYSWGFLDGEINGRIVELVGSRPGALTIGQQEGAVKQKADTLKFREEEYNGIRTNDDPSLNDPSFVCIEANKESIEKACSPLARKPVSAGARPLFCNTPFSYQHLCSDYLETIQRAKPIVDPHSILGQIDSQIILQHDAQAADEKALDESDPDSEISRYNKAKKALEDAQKPSTKCDQSVNSSQPSCLQQASAAVGSALKDLEKSGSVAASLKAHEEQIAAIDKVLQSVIDGKSAAKAADSPDQKQALSIVATIPSLEKQIGSSFNRPLVGSLILESERLRLESEALRRDLSRRETHLTLLGEKRDAVLNEFNLLRRAHRFLSLDDPVTESNCKKDKGLVTNYREFPNGYCRESIVAGLSTYAQSWNAGRKQEERQDYKLIALSYTESLDKTELALMQWQNLIQVPLNQTATYYASGIKPDDIAKFLQAAGIAATAAGVNH
jgi:hypothetical protein